MVIAFLALLGVDLVVLVLFASFVLGRRRWLRSQAGVFPCAIRAAHGEIDGLGSTFHRGYARWVRDVLVFTKAPLLLRNELLPADGLDGGRPAHAGEVKRLGDHPVVIQVRTGGAMAEIAAARDVGDRLSGPYPLPVVDPADAGSPAAAVADGREPA